MEKGYVKLYRAIDENELLANDNTCYVVFCKLLTHVDRTTGTYRTGRYKLAAICNLNPNTLYSALKRLEASTMIQQDSNSTSTCISICNWWKYQQDSNSTATERRRTVNTKQEREREEEIDTNVSMAKTPSVEIDELFVLWEEITGMEIVGQVRKNRFACSNLLKKHGKEKLTKLINGVALAQADKFAPRIADFSALQSKQNELITWGKTNQSSAMKKVAVI